VFSLVGLLSHPVLAQTDVGSPCRVGEGIASVESVFDSGVDDIDSSPYIRVFPIEDVNGDGSADILVVDYYERSHFAAVADGVSGDIFYSLESVSPDGYYFAVDAYAIDDVDEDGVADFVLVSHDSFLQIVDVMVISGVDGSGVARISEEIDSALTGVYTVTPFSDTDKSGTTDSQDIYIVIDSAGSGVLDPATDVNLDGVTNSQDVQVVQVGPISMPLVARIAGAFGGTSSGMQITIPVQAESGLLGWFRKVWTCATCLINCADSYADAWECKELLKQAECDCWDLPDLFDVSACLDDLRLNFLPGCLQDVADAAGDCGQCILDCHPLAP